jgi:hypothetical protein
MARREEQYEVCWCRSCLHRASHWLPSPDLFACPEHGYVGREKVLIFRDAIYRYHARRLAERFKDAPAGAWEKAWGREPPPGIRPLSQPGLDS